MSFFAVLFALLIEQLKPLPRGNVVHDSLTGWTRWTRLNFDAGREAPDQAGAQHQLVADHLGFGRDFLDGGDRVTGPAHASLGGSGGSAMLRKRGQGVMGR